MLATVAFLILLASSQAHSQTMPAEGARLIFDTAAKGKDQGERAVAEIDAMIATGALGNPILQRAKAYKAGALMLQARDSIWPPTKLKYAKLGIALLNEAVSEAPEDLEIRVLRLNCSLPLPSFLLETPLVLEDAQKIELLLPQEPTHTWLAIMARNLLTSPDLKKIQAKEKKK